MASKIKFICNQIYDPYSKFIFHWKRFMFIICVINVCVDPMFMYIPKLDKSKTTMHTDMNLGATIALLRSIGDCFLLLNIIVKFRTAYEAPGSRIFKRRRLIEEPKDIAVNYLKSCFILDLIAALPLPQVYIWKQILASKSALGNATDPIDIYYNIYILFSIQFIPRLGAVAYSKKEITEAAGVLVNSGLSGALYNLLWFVILSNILGAIYYCTHLNWVSWCKVIAAQKGSARENLGWDQALSACTQNNEIEMGIFSKAIENKIGIRTFIQKYMFCFSWGLKSLSSLGQNFTTSSSTSETSLSILITLLGLIFFADLITRMQAGIQSMEEREEQQRARQREVKEWMDYHQLPLHIKGRVDYAIQSEWTDNGIDDETMLDSLPMDLRSEIRKHLYIDSVCKLPKFADMDTPLVEAICQHLKTFSSKESTYIVYEGDLVEQMLFVFSGQLELSFTDRGNSNLTVLGPGECCGQELLTWATQPTTSMDNLPSSTWTIKCLTDVEAFVLQAYDMKILATEFAHNQEFQHAFKQHYP